jgi:hypothetical protein
MSLTAGRFSYKDSDLWHLGSLTLLQDGWLSLGFDPTFRHVVPNFVFFQIVHELFEQPSKVGGRDRRHDDELPPDVSEAPYGDDAEELSFIRGGDVDRLSARETDTEIFSRGQISNFSNEKRFLAWLRNRNKVLSFGFYDPVSKSEILDTALLGEGRAAHAALLAPDKDFRFVFRAISGSTNAVALDHGGSRGVRLRCHSSTSYDITTRSG